MVKFYFKGKHNTLLIESDIMLYGYTFGSKIPIEKVKSLYIGGVGVRLRNGKGYIIFREGEYHVGFTIEVWDEDNLLIETCYYYISLNKVVIGKYDEFIKIDVLQKPEDFGVNPIIADRMFPIWKIELEERLFGNKDGDIYNDVRKTGVIKYYRRKSVNSGWVEEYSERVEDFNFAFHKAAITLSKLREKIEYFDRDNIIMFEYQDKMYRIKYHRKNEKCLVGEEITEYSVNDEVEVNYLNEIVFVYERDSLVFRKGKIYLNGELVLTKEKLKELYGIDYKDVESYIHGEIKKKIESIFPTARAYYTGNSVGYLNENRCDKCRIGEYVNKAKTYKTFNIEGKEILVVDIIAKACNECGDIRIRPSVISKIKGYLRDYIKYSDFSNTVSYNYLKDNFTKVTASSLEKE